MYAASKCVCVDKAICSLRTQFIQLPVNAHLVKLINNNKAQIIRSYLGQFAAARQMLCLCFPQIKFDLRTASKVKFSTFSLASGN